MQNCPTEGRGFTLQKISCTCRLRMQQCGASSQRGSITFPACVPFSWRSLLERFCHLEMSQVEASGGYGADRGSLHMLGGARGANGGGGSLLDDALRGAARERQRQQHASCHKQAHQNAWLCHPPPLPPLPHTPHTVSFNLRQIEEMQCRASWLAIET
jgi:hypothetical protein